MKSDYIQREVLDLKSQYGNNCDNCSTLFVKHQKVELLSQLVRGEYQIQPHRKHRQFLGEWRIATDLECNLLSDIFRNRFAGFFEFPKRF